VNVLENGELIFLLIFFRFPKIKIVSDSPQKVSTNLFFFYRKPTEQLGINYLPKNPNNK